DHAQLLGAREHLLRDLGAAADHQALGVADPLEQLRRGEARRVIDLDAAGVLEDLEPLRRQRVADEHPGHPVPLRAAAPATTRGRRTRRDAPPAARAASRSITRIGTRAWGPGPKSAGTKRKAPKRGEYPGRSHPCQRRRARRAGSLGCRTDATSSK